MPRQFAVLVPVKPPAHGKSRLVGVGDDTRRALAEAFALDTVEACLQAELVAAVLVVTDDATLARTLADLGAEAVPDGTTSDLNGTLTQTAAEAHRRWPHLAIAAVCADLPALRPDDLDAALAAASQALDEGHAAFLPDAAGIGTTIYAAAADRFDPRFGGSSRDAHRAATASELTADAPSARRDVDDLLDLRAAQALGLRRRTLAVAEGAGLV